MSTEFGGRYFLYLTQLQFMTVYDNDIYTTYKICF